MLLTLKRYATKLYMKKTLKLEQTYNNGECQLKHLFIQNKQSNKLLVVFSGFPQKGNPPVYNYVLTFRKINCNKLYILDNFGNDRRGSYYLGKEGDFFIDRAVTQLIKKISIDNNIKKEDVIAIGSSKGGFASLYFALKNGYGAAIAGEPQILIGDYLSIYEHQPIYKYIIGEINNKNTRKLNSLLFELVSQETKTKIYLHCGNSGYYYICHIKPFIEYLEKNKIDYNLDLGNYSAHSEVGRYFPPFAINVIKNEIKD